MPAIAIVTAPATIASAETLDSGAGITARPETHDTTVDAPIELSTSMTANTPPARRTKRERRLCHPRRPPEGGQLSLSGHHGGRDRRPRKPLMLPPPCSRCHRR